MKRLVPLLMGLSLVSCDSGTKHTEGTSSETQTALQALADNVREEPVIPGAAPISLFAGRAMEEDPIACWAAVHWTRAGFYQAESYDGSTGFGIWPEDDLPVWASIRNELATDSQGADPGACPTGYMQTYSQQSWKTKSGTRGQSLGHFWRDRDTGGMTMARWEGALRFASGFELRSLQVRFGPNLVLEADTMRKTTYSFAEGRYSFAFRYSLGERGSVLPESWSTDDSTDCVDIRDEFRADQKVGSVCAIGRMDAWVIRDDQGKVVSPQRVSTSSLDDSMGVRVLSTRWDGDSLRIRFRVKTAPFTLRQWSRTAVVLSDSVYRNMIDPIPPLEKMTVFADTNFVGPESGSLVASTEELAGRTTLRLELHRTYRSPNGSRFIIGTWWFRIPPRDD